MRRCRFLSLHFSPRESQTLCCVFSAFIFLCPHTSHNAMEIPPHPWSLVLALRGQERQSTRHQIKSLVLSRLGARLPGVLLCVLVCLSPSPDRWGPRPPRRRGLVPAPPGRAGHSSPPPLFVPLAGAGQPDAARTRETGQDCPDPPGSAFYPAPPPAFPSPLLAVPPEEGWANSS